MFSNIIDVLQGPAVEAIDEVPTQAAPTQDEAHKQEREGTTKPGAQSGEPGGSFSIWGMASALADSVKRTTADISASVSETDWGAELEAFGKGVAEDANEVQRHTQAAVREGATRIETLPKQAAKARFPPVDPAKVKTQLDEVGNRLGRFGHNLLSGSKELFEQVAEAVQHELDGIEGHVAKPRKTAQARAARQAQKDAPKYSRLEAEISAMQRNSSTYCDQPQDAEDFATWLETFDLESKKADIEAIAKENAFMAELQSRIVPLIVQYEVFWTRYFYQLEKLHQRHEQRQNVVQLAAQNPAEQVSWDDEDDEQQADAKLGASEGSATEEQALPAATPGDAHSAENAKASAGASDAAAMPHITSVKAASALGEDEPDTSTASDDSGNGPWTVVTSPSHRRMESAEAISRPTPVPEDSHGSGDGDAVSASGAQGNSTTLEAAVPANPINEAEEDDEELDIDISDEEGAGPEGDESEVEEDWGLWA